MIKINYANVSIWFFELVLVCDNLGFSLPDLFVKIIYFVLFKYIASISYLKVAYISSIIYPKSKIMLSSLSLPN